MRGGNPFLVALLLCTALANGLAVNRQPYVTIDSFLDSDTVVVIIVPPGGAPPAFEQPDFEVDAGILGGERDVLVRVLEAGSQNVFSITTLDNVFSFSSPPNTQSQLLIQYDGPDADMELNRTGLSSVDMTQGGLADSVHIKVQADLDTTLLMTFYTSDQDARAVLLDLNAGVEHEFEVPFTQFGGAGSFTDIGAVELFVDATTSVDATFSELFSSGEVVGAPSPSPSPLPSASPSPLPNELDRIYMMVPLQCAPDWPRFIPEFETSSYSTSYTTTTSESSDDDDDDSSSSSNDDDDDDNSSSYNDDDDNSSSSNNDDDDDDNSTSNSSTGSSDDDDNDVFLNVSNLFSSGGVSSNLRNGQSFASSDYSSSFYKNFIFGTSSDASTVTLSMAAVLIHAAALL